MDINKYHNFYDVYNELSTNRPLFITDYHLSNINTLYSLFLLGYDLSYIKHRIKSPICYELLERLGIKGHYTNYWINDYYQL